MVVEIPRASRAVVIVSALSRSVSLLRNRVTLSILSRTLSRCDCGVRLDAHPDLAIGVDNGHLNGAIHLRKKCKSGRWRLRGQDILPICMNLNGDAMLHTKITNKVKHRRLVTVAQIQVPDVDRFNDLERTIRSLAKRQQTSKSSNVFVRYQHLPSHEPADLAIVLHLKRPNNLPLNTKNAMKTDATCPG